MSETTGTMEEARAKAHIANCDLVEGDDYTLLIDFDGYGQSNLENHRDLIDDLWGIESEERWPSKSREDHHEHVVIKLKEPLNVTQRLALQAALGSDPKREILGIARQTDAGDEGEVSLLFKPRPLAIAAT